MSLVSPLLLKFNKIQSELAVANQQFKQLEDIDRKSQIRGKPSELYFSGELEKFRDKKEALEIQLKELTDQISFSQNLKPHYVPAGLIALYLARSQWACYKLLTADDLIQASRNKPTDNSNRIENVFKAIQHLVISSIVKLDSTEDRRAALVTWVRVASYLRKLCDFQTLQAVIHGLRSPELADDKKLWSALNKTQQEKLKSMQEILSSTGHYAKYHEVFYKISSDTKCVPNIYVAIHDLAYVEATPTLAFDLNDSNNAAAQIQVTRDFILHKTLLFSRLHAKSTFLYDIDDIEEWSKKHVWCGKAKELKLHRYSEEDLALTVSHWALSSLMYFYTKIKVGKGSFQPMSTPTVCKTPGGMPQTFSFEQAFPTNAQENTPPFQSLMSGLSLTPSSSEPSSLSSSSVSPPLSDTLQPLKETNQQQRGNQVSFKTIAKVAAALTYFSKPTAKDVNSVSCKYSKQSSAADLVPGCFPERNGSDTQPLRISTARKPIKTLPAPMTSDGTTMPYSARFCNDSVNYPARFSSLSGSTLSGSSTSLSDTENSEVVHRMASPPILTRQHVSGESFDKSYIETPTHMTSSDMFVSPPKFMSMPRLSNSHTFGRASSASSPLPTSTTPIPPPRHRQRAVKQELAPSSAIAPPEPLCRRHKMVRPL